MNKDPKEWEKRTIIYQFSELQRAWQALVKSIIETVNYEIKTDSQDN